MMERIRLPGADEAPLSAADERELARLLAKIQRDRGFNGQFYKEKCLRRRLAVRMRARGVAGYAEYAALLDADAAEYDILLDTLTINVTKFFRNLEVWQLVEREVVPALFAAAGAARQVRVWSAGSSSGEEAYTASILLHEWAAHHRRAAELRRIRVTGTDIDRRSLDTARRGEYPEISLTETPPDVRERWFSPGPPYRLREEAKSIVSFTRRDLISEEPEPGQSLILCRNVIIYFEREIQERLFERFYDALLPGGFLVLGKVETLLGTARSRFRALSNRERVFQKPE